MMHSPAFELSTRSFIKIILWRMVSTTIDQFDRVAERVYDCLRYRYIVEFKFVRGCDV